MSTTSAAPSNAATSTSRAAGPGLRRDEFRLRGLGKLTVVILADLIASNLGKIYNIASGDHELYDREHDRAA